MQFVTNGPDIPDSLLQAHEEGRVVFFCGAGVSVPAKLPDFRQLVEDIFKQTDPRKTPQEEATFNDCKYDSTLNLLEHRFPLGRMAVRRALVSALTRRSFPQSATETHSALLCYPERMTTECDWSPQILTLYLNWQQAGSVQISRFLCAHATRP
ncbi:hypothetical protein [Pectobacterium brasiliense]|uniref:hypothetical protein n=1 Tax=Pectobacterium brasiliense TaxID=180957 RepID=UPI0038731763